MVERKILTYKQYFQDFINSICFYDAKRAINKDMLMRMYTFRFQPFSMTFY